MGPFYVCLGQDVSPTQPPSTCWLGSPLSLVTKQDEGKWNPYLVTFLNREAADEWWWMTHSRRTTFPFRATHITTTSPVSSEILYCRTPDNSTKRWPSWFSIMQCFIQSCSQITSVVGGKFLETLIFCSLDKIIGFLTGTLYGPKLIPGAGSTDGTCLVYADIDCDAIHVSSKYLHPSLQPGRRLLFPRELCDN